MARIQVSAPLSGQWTLTAVNVRRFGFVPVPGMRFPSAGIIIGAELPAATVDAFVAIVVVLLAVLVPIHVPFFVSVHFHIPLQTASRSLRRRSCQSIISATSRTVGRSARTTSGRRVRGPARRTGQYIRSRTVERA